MTTIHSGFSEGICHMTICLYRNEQDIKIGRPSQSSVEDRCPRLLGTILETRFLFWASRCSVSVRDLVKTSSMLRWRNRRSSQTYTCLQHVFHRNIQELLTRPPPGRFIKSGIVFLRFVPRDNGIEFRRTILRKLSKSFLLFSL